MGKRKPILKTTKMNTMKFASAFMMLSDMTSTTDKEKLETKQRIVFATMRHHIPDWQPPSNWEKLSTTEKLKRLEGIQHEPWD